MIKRLLIMIPTFIGVSIAIWAVMTLAPGEPAGAGQSQGFGSDATQDLKNLERADRNIRIYREQFALNRPRFYNDWTDLEPADVSQALSISVGGVAAHGAGPVKRARRQLADWGNFAIPSLVELLPQLEGEMQNAALRSLRKSAYKFKKGYPTGYQPTEAEVASDAAIDVENDEIQKPGYVWKADASGEERAAVVSTWQTWYQNQQALGRWSYQDDYWDRVGIKFLDTQFGRYWGNLARGDLGRSFRTEEPVVDMIFARLKYSLSLAVPSFLIAWILAVFLGVVSAANHNSPLDRSLALGLFMLYSIPSFLMATVVQQGLAVDWDLFPVSRFESANAKHLNVWEHFRDILWHLALPMFCYTYGALAYISRQARSGMLEVLKSDFVRTARAKGMSESTVIWKHAVRNGMMPIITLLGTALPVLLGGSVVIEYIFEIDGFGLLMLNAILNKDYNVVLGVALISAVLTLIGLLISDILYAAVDPRVSLE